MRSISVPTSVQVQSTPLPLERLYLATNGCDLVEQALSVDWMLQLCLEYVRANGVSLAVWLIEGENEPRIIAAVVPQPSHCAIVKMI